MRDFVKLSAEFNGDQAGGGGGVHYRGTGRVATAAFRMGRRSPLRGEGDVGLSGSLAGGDTTPCD